MKPRPKGFTLVELLVVISIISLLASVIIVSLKSSLTKARDSRRVQEIHTIGTAFESCFGTRGNYPNPSGGIFSWDYTGSGWQYSWSCSVCPHEFADAIKSCTTALSDPINQSPYAYYYFHFDPTATTYSGATVDAKCKGHYAFMAHLENPNYTNWTNDGCFHQTGQNEYWFILGQYFQ